MKYTVLCLNDCTIGVYSTEQLADAAALADWKAREPQWERQGLAFKESTSHMVGGVAYKYVRWFYHSHEFELDAPACL